MRSFLFLAAVVLGGCVVGADGTNPPAGDDDQQPPVDPPGTPRVCPLDQTMPDAGDLSALKAQQCNVSGSQGALHYYRLSATLPSGAMDVVQLELYDGKGPFAAGTVQPGTYTISGADASFATCGVCVRAIGDKGAAGSTSYFATGGTVTVTSVGLGGGAISATISNATFSEVDATTNAAVTGGCSAQLAAAKIDGTVVVSGGGGGGGGGGGACPTGIGD